jgi:Tol biopolymer transport system component
MDRKYILRNILLIFVLMVPSMGLVSADDISPDPMEASLISDLNQTIGKDALSHVDKSRLDAYGSPILSFYWDPSGTRVLVFVLIDVCTKNEVSQTTLGQVQALYIANGDGSREKLIAWAENTPYTRERNKHNGIAIPVWNPSGDSFLYQESSSGNVHFIGGIHSINVVDSESLDLLAKEQISLEGPVYEWSPKGDKLLYAGFNEKKESSIFILDLENNVSKETPVKNYKTKFSNNDFIWSPDEKRVVFAEEGDLFILNPASNEVNTVFSADNICFDRAVWSPDSSKLAAYEFIGNEEPGKSISNIYIIDVEHQKSNKVVSLNYGIVYGWLLDSNNIIFQELSENETGSIYTLYSMSIDGSNKTRLFSSSSDFVVSLSPSGKFIEITHSSGKYNRLSDQGIIEYILMSSNGSGEKHWNIFQNGYAWNNNGGLVLGVANETQSNMLAVINTSTKEIKTIKLPVSYIEEISWSPSGRYLIAKTFSPETSSYEGNSYEDYASQDYLLELPEYDLPMLLEIEGSIEVKTEINVSVRSSSGKIGNVTIFVGNESVGTTDEKGTLAYRFSKEGEFQIRAVKEGYSTARRMVTVKDTGEQKISNEVTPEIVHPLDANDAELPGFTAYLVCFGLISALFFHKINKK